MKNEPIFELRLFTLVFIYCSHCKVDSFFQRFSTEKDRSHLNAANLLHDLYWRQKIAWSLIYTMWLNCCGVINEFDFITCSYFILFLYDCLIDNESMIGIENANC